MRQASVRVIKPELRRATHGRQFGLRGNIAICFLKRYETRAVCNQADQGDQPAAGE